MLSVSILCVGKLKEKFFIEACLEYSKRLSKYCKLIVNEISEQPIPETASNAQLEAALSREGSELLSKIPKGAYIVAMCVEGGQLSSTALAKKLEELALNGNSSLCFIIGGSNGLSESVKTGAHLKLSMSEMTFPHHLARVMLLEQIYRAFKINEGSGYHK